ncbi:hypothetical protein J2Z47_001915 [Cohnella thailandensis]|nr:DUF5665 domain-containing protein [Cohnella thailandensis]MBP1973694.1 hypothetical protein [Cohnella thailandensis]
MAKWRSRRRSMDKRRSQPKQPALGEPVRASMEASASLGKEPSPLQSTLETLTERIDRLAVDMEKAELKEYVNLMRRPWGLIWRNFVSGLFRGIGIALGFTFFAATIVWLLQLLGALNLPVVGDYIADIVRIVQRQLEINPY